MGKKVILFLIVFLISFFLSEIVLMQRKYTIVNGAKSLRLINGCEMVFVNWCSMISGFSWFIQWCWIALERTASGCGLLRWFCRYLQWQCWLRLFRVWWSPRLPRYAGGELVVTVEVSSHQKQKALARPFRGSNAQAYAAIDVRHRLQGTKRLFFPTPFFLFVHGSIHYPYVSAACTLFPSYFLICAKCFSRTVSVIINFAIPAHRRVTRFGSGIIRCVTLGLSPFIIPCTVSIFYIRPFQLYGACW